MFQNNFVEYKMSLGDSNTTHVNKVMSMGNLLKDLGQLVQEDMVITKVICSLLSSYNIINLSLRLGQMFPHWNR